MKLSRDILNSRGLRFGVECFQLIFSPVKWTLFVPLFAKLHWCGYDVKLKMIWFLIGDFLIKRSFTSQLNRMDDSLQCRLFIDGVLTIWLYRVICFQTPTYGVYFTNGISFWTGLEGSCLRLVCTWWGTWLNHGGTCFFFLICKEAKKIFNLFQIRLDARFCYQ